MTSPLPDAELAAIRVRFENTTHTDWRADTDMGRILAELDRARAELATAKVAGMREAAALLRKYCPRHDVLGGVQAFMSCHCPGADAIDATAAVSAPTA